MRKIIRITYRFNDIIDTFDFEDEDIQTKDDFYELAYDRLLEEIGLEPAAVDVCNCAECQKVLNELDD